MNILEFSRIFENAILNSISVKDQEPLKCDDRLTIDGRERKNEREREGEMLKIDDLPVSRRTMELRNRNTGAMSK